MLKAKDSHYISILAIPLVLMTVWSVIVFIIGVLGALRVEIAGSLLVGGILGIIGSIVGVVMALLVGFNSVKHKTKTTTGIIKMGALFGAITGIINAFLEIINYLFSLFTGTTVITGLQGISLPLLVEIIAITTQAVPMIEQLDFLMGTIITVISVLVFIIINIISSMILALISGQITKEVME